MENVNSPRIKGSVAPPFSFLRVIGIGLAVSLAGPLFFYFLNQGSVLGEDKAVRRVGEMSDQAVLTEFALHSDSEKARLAAIGKLEDQKLLARIAQTNWKEEFQRQALSRIWKQGILAELVIRAGRSGITVNNPDPRVALEAMEKIGDRTFLERISREAKDEGIRKSAAAKLAT